MIVLSLKIKTGPFLMRSTYLVEMIADQNFYDICFTFLCFGLRPKAEVCQGRTFAYRRRWKLRLRSSTGPFIFKTVCARSSVYETRYNFKKNLPNLSKLAPADISWRTLLSQTEKHCFNGWMNFSMPWIIHKLPKYLVKTQVHEYKNSNALCKYIYSTLISPLKSIPVLDQRPKFYSQRFKTYGYGYGGWSLRPFLRPKVLFVVFLVFFQNGGWNVFFITQVCHLRLN